MPENVENAVETFVLARPAVESPVFDEANLPGLEYAFRFKGDTWDWGTSRNHDSRKMAWSKFTVSGDVFCERILAEGYNEACALLESMDAPLPEPCFVHGSSFPIF